MLSSQTKDEVTDAAVDKLRAALGGTLSLDALIAAEEHVVADCISKVGFWRRKTQSVPHFALPTSRWRQQYQVHKASGTAPARRVRLGCPEDRRRAVLAAWRRPQNGFSVLTRRLGYVRQSPPFASC